MTDKNAWRIKEEIEKWLTRVGVNSSDIQFPASTSVDVKKKNSWKSTSHSQASVKYVFKNKEYVMSCKLNTEYTENLNHIQILVHSRIIGIERGIEDVEQAFAGYTALSYANTPRSILGLDEDADKESCKAAFKRIAKVYHPDSGGSTELFTRINKAIQEIEAEQ